jgi:hypothetical protein
VLRPSGTGEYRNGIPPSWTPSLFFTSMMIAKCRELKVLCREDGKVQHRLNPWGRLSVTHAGAPSKNSS